MHMGRSTESKLGSPYSNSHQQSNERTTSKHASGAMTPEWIDAATKQTQGKKAQEQVLPIAPQAEAQMEWVGCESILAKLNQNRCHGPNLAH